MTEPLGQYRSPGSAGDGGVPFDDGSVSVVTIDEHNDGQLDVGYWASLARKVLIAEGVEGAAEMSLTFVDEDAIADLNARYMDSEGPTDVLSFPIDGETIGSPDGELGDNGVPLLLGDVVICPVVAERNAPDHAGTFDDEVALLVVHGVLHLLGYDHMDDDDRAVMQGRERELLASLHGEPARWPWN